MVTTAYGSQWWRSRTRRITGVTPTWSLGASVTRRCSTRSRRSRRKCRRKRTGNASASRPCSRTSCRCLSQLSSSLSTTALCGAPTWSLRRPPPPRPRPETCSQAAWPTSATWTTLSPRHRCRRQRRDRVWQWQRRQCNGRKYKLTVINLCLQAD